MDLLPIISYPPYFGTKPKANTQNKYLSAKSHIILQCYLMNDPLFDRHSGKQLREEHFAVVTQEGKKYDIRGTPGHYLAKESMDMNPGQCKIHQNYQLSNMNIETGAVLEGVSTDKYKTPIKTSRLARVEKSVTTL